MATAVKSGDLVASRYRIECVLGRGGMGVIVAAHDTRLNVPVAMKLLAGEDGNVERFFREARAVSMIESDHVVRVLELGSLDAKQPYMVMERLRGLDLGQRLKREGPLEATDVADVALQACEALAHAHAAGIVHRDIKPSNLFEHELASGARVLKVLDFGISKATSRDEWDDRSLTSSYEGGLLGSPAYMSPEHVREPRSVDRRTDIWSLGVVMYRLLSGVHPFDGDSFGEMFAAILERRMIPLRDFRPHLDPAFDAIVSRCLARSRGKRFQNVGELAEAIAPFASPRLRPLAARVREICARSSPALRLAREDEPTTLTVPPRSEAPIPSLRLWRAQLRSGRLRALGAVAAGMCLSIGLGVIATTSTPAVTSAATAPPPAVVVLPQAAAPRADAVKVAPTAASKKPAAHTNATVAPAKTPPPSQPASPAPAASQRELQPNPYGASP